jgi:hypothetical protein
MTKRLVDLTLKAGAKAERRAIMRHLRDLRIGNSYTAVTLIDSLLGWLRERDAKERK